MSIEIKFKNGSCIKTINNVSENGRSKPKEFMWEDTIELEKYLIENNMIQGDD